MGVVCILAIIGGRGQSLGWFLGNLWVWSLSLSQPGQYVDGCHLVLSHVPEASLDLSLEGETWRRMGDDDSTATCTVSPVCLFLSGVAQVRGTEGRRWGSTRTTPSHCALIAYHMCN